MSDKKPPQNPDEARTVAQKQTRAIRLGLGAKIMVMMSLIVIFTGTATLVLVSDQMKTAMLGEFESKGKGIVRSLATSSEEHLVEEDRPAVQAFIDQFKKIKGVKYIAISDPSGEIINQSLHTFPQALRQELQIIDQQVKKTLLEAEEVDSQEDDSEEIDITLRDLVIDDFGHVLDVSLPILLGELGYAHVGMDLKIVEDEVSRIIVRVVFLFVGFLFIGLLAVYLSSKRLIKPLNNMLPVLEKVSNGNLDVRTHSATRDELATLSQRTNHMIRSLKDIVSGVRTASVDVDGFSQQILSSSQEQERGASEQSASIEELTRSMDGLTQTAQSIASNANGMKQTAEDVSGKVQQGQEALESSRDSMKQILSQNHMVADRINSLYEKTQAIISVVDIIDDISDRLDLLALNAAIEGSRAGEAGKGFSLVAQEMRRLAENVAGSTKEIKETIREIHRHTQASLDASQHSSDTTQTGSDEMEKMVAVMTRIFDLIASVINSTREVTVITQQQLSSSQQMSEALNELGIIAVQGLASAQQVTQAASGLAEMSVVLRERVAVFSAEDRSAPAVSQLAPSGSG